MKLHQLITTLIILCLPHTSWSMENKSTDSYWIINPKTASPTEKEFEEVTQQALDNFSKKLTFTAPKTKILLSDVTYTAIQNQFTPTAKQRIASFQKIELNETDKKKLLNIGQTNKKISLNPEQQNLLENIRQIELQIAEHQKLKKQNQEQIQQLEAAIDSAKKEKKRQRNAHKRARQKAKKQQSTLSIKSTIQTPSAIALISNTAKSNLPTLQHNFYKKRMIALKTLFTKYNVQKEADLKKKFYDICNEVNKNYLDDRINYCCTFEYCAETNELEIFTDDYADATSDSDHD